MNRVEEIAAVNRTPMRWPGVWKDAALLDLLGDKGINCLIFETNENLDEVRTQARQRGLAVFNREALPSDVAVIKGTWPGVRLVRASRGGERFTAGPTGDPWVDSNGWRIRLEAARQPGRSVWLDADPRKPWLFAESYLLGVADAATYGGR
jgi:hypothetical protein